MRTPIDIDDALLSEAFRHSDAKTKTQLVHQALSEFVRNHSQRDLRDLRGKITFWKDYNHKALRRG